MTKIKLSELKANLDNPRVIHDAEFKKLCNSIKEFPKMLEKRPIAVDKDYMVLGGNMRLKALEELGYEEIPSNWIIDVSDLTEEEKERFIIVDNISYGEWNYDELANKFNQSKLIDWGFKKFEFTGGYSAETKNKEIDVDSLEEETSITLKYTGDDYLKFIEKVNRLRNNGETYEAFFMRMLDVSL